MICIFALCERRANDYTSQERPFLHLAILSKVQRLLNGATFLSLQPENENVVVGVWLVMSLTRRTRGPHTAGRQPQPVQTRQGPPFPDWVGLEAAFAPVAGRPESSASLCGLKTARVMDDDEDYARVEASRAEGSPLEAAVLGPPSSARVRHSACLLGQVLSVLAGEHIVPWDRPPPAWVTRIRGLDMPHPFCVLCATADGYEAPREHPRHLRHQCGRRGECGGALACVVARATAGCDTARP
jgi:hypothetical protein